MRQRRRRSPLVPLLAVGLLLAGIGGGVLAAVFATNDADPASTAPITAENLEPREVTTTVPGGTVMETVIATVTVEAPPVTPETSPPPQTSPPTATPAVAPSLEGHQLNDEGFTLMQDGRYEEALPLLQQAAQALAGAGPSDPYEGWANYNLGYTLLQFGRCDEALAALKRSDQLQDRGELDAAITAAEQCASGS